MLPINLLRGGLIVIHRPELSHLPPKLAGISARIEWMPSLATHRPQVGCARPVLVDRQGPHLSRNVPPRPTQLTMPPRWLATIWWPFIGHNVRFSQMRQCHRSASPSLTPHLLAPASTSATNGLPFPIRVGTVFERDRPAQMDAGLAPQCLSQESRVRAPATRRHLYTAFATRCRKRLSRGPLDGEGKIVERNPHRGAGTAITFHHSATASPLEAQDDAEGRRCRSGRA